MKDLENSGGAARPAADYPISPVDLRSVTVEDGFWAPRLETNRTVTIPAVFRKCESSGRLDNFRRAAGRMPGPYVGTMPFEDTEVYKALEGASCSLATHPDPQREEYVDGVIALVAAAQEKDGYLYTNRTVDPYHVLPFSGPERWSNMVMSHELYNCGHLYEAAAAHYMATGRRDLLEIALRSAALVRNVFGPQGRHDVCGHQIVEMGLARLYRITGDRGYLETARFFLEERGRHEERPLYQYAGNPRYAQDHAPVREQREAVGHAVRAAYMYCGMADVAALFPDTAYAEAIRAIWRDVVDTKVYLTGGIGARHTGEAFGEAFELPNDTAYAETCAAIGSVMWNHRLFLLSGEAKFIDAAEQTLFNGVLSGVSLSGDEYFYVNPLASDGAFTFNHGSATRQPWFEVSCCPTSLCRFLPSLPGYVYAAAGDAVYVNLFVTGRTEVETPAGRIRIIQETGYPWSGDVRLTVGPADEGTRGGAGGSTRRLRVKLMVRVPGWARESIMGGSLYRFEAPVTDKPSLRLNGELISSREEGGYAVIDREWAAGDVVELSFPMPIRSVLCDPRVEANRGKAALMRGPIVYCVEGRDAETPLEGIRLNGARGLTASPEPGTLGGIVAIKGPGFTAIPYYTWSNRGPGPMRVWLENGES